MISVVTTFNPKSSNIANIKIAINSWLKVSEISEIFLYEVDPSICPQLTDGANSRLKFYFENSGLPRLNRMIDFINSNSSNNYLMLINSDIIIQADFSKIINILSAVKQNFLISGWRRNFFRASDISNINGQNIISNFQIQHGGMDYFIFKRGSFYDFPNYFIGRGAFDYAFIWYAKSKNYILINATESISAYHFEHVRYNRNSGYHSHYLTKEYAHNRMIIPPKVLYKFSLRKADYLLTESGLLKISFSIINLAYLYFEYICGILYQFLLTTNSKYAHTSLYFLGRVYKKINSVLIYKQ